MRVRFAASVFYAPVSFSALPTCQRAVLVLVNSVVPARDRDKPVREPVREPPRVYAPPEAPPQILAASAENGATLEGEHAQMRMNTLC